MTNAALTKELIDDTSLMRLILRIGPTRLSALIVGSEGVERRVLFHSEELHDASVKSLENAVYDNPLLLGDFRTIDIIFSTPELFTAPDFTAPLRDAMAEAMLPDYEAPRLIQASPFGDGDVCYAVDAGIFNFTARTFACARFHHSLAVDALGLRGLDGHEGLYALCEGDGEMNIVAFAADGSTRHLNRTQPRGAMDCAYYILAAAAAGEVLTIGGDPALRGDVSETLLKVDPNVRVLPLSLPDDLLNLRRLAPEAPFDMIFLTRQ